MYRRGVATRCGVGSNAYFRRQRISLRGPRCAMGYASNCAEPDSTAADVFTPEGTLSCPKGSVSRTKGNFLPEGKSVSRPKESVSVTKGAFLAGRGAFSSSKESPFLTRMGASYPRRTVSCVYG